MRRVETGPRFIFFTRISLKHRYSEQDKLDAELTATAFEKVKDDKSKKKADAAKAAAKKE
jgi:Tfp pilus assembly protein PilO